MNGQKTFRCAIYTRKSSEEGLDQDFNSLEAQREACEAYIRSQAHEGWKIVPELLDDGGYSGGNTDRPALHRLMELVKAGEIDVIVIYKVDRLTRSLTDFARMAETFDKHNVSFVSVTQQFNTTTSMGRLMLNVLLSFAQFEREITGERIRDKIAASKKKGMWMGGNPPMGYDVRDRQLVINETDAPTVRRIFSAYLEVGNVPALMQRLETEGVRTARRYSAKGQHHGERPFTRGHLYKLLTNPIYIGRVPHKTTSHPGQHHPIIDKALWESVQLALGENVQGPRSRRKRASKPRALIAGVLVSASGNGFIESHATKGSRRYRYYVEDQPDPKKQAIRLPAIDIENAVSSSVAEFLRDRRALAGNLRAVERTAVGPALESGSTLAERLGSGGMNERIKILRPLVQKVTYRESSLQVDISGPQLHEALGVAAKSEMTGINYQPEDVVLTGPITARRRGRQLKLVLDVGQPASLDVPLITAVARAHVWAQDLVTGRVTSVSEIADQEGVSLAYVSQLLPLGFLEPAIVEAIAVGRQPADLTANQLIWRTKVPPGWNRQGNGTLGAGDLWRPGPLADVGALLAPARAFRRPVDREG